MALYVLLQLLLLTTALASSIAKPGCQDKCGNVTIPYPFGIGDPNCFIKGFNITCNTTFSPPKPFLYGRRIEVLEILLQGQIRVTGWMRWDCYSETEPGDNSSIGSANFTGTPYMFSEAQNMFTAIGCDTLAYVQGPNGTEFTTGCASMCVNRDKVSNGTCSGIGCCKTPIAHGLKFLKFSLLSFANHTLTKDFSPCSYAFVVDKDYFNFSIPLMSLQDFSDESKRRFPMVLDWVIGNKTCETARRSPLTYRCGLKSTCNDLPAVAMAIVAIALKASKGTLTFLMIVNMLISVPRFLVPAPKGFAIIRKEIIIAAAQRANMAIMGKTDRVAKMTNFQPSKLF